MSCIVSITIADTGREKVVRRGTEPKGPADWRVSAWFILPNGEKHTHSALIQRETVRGLVPAVGQLIDSLVADNGNAVTSAGWTATTHGRKRRRR